MFNSSIVMSSIVMSSIMSSIMSSGYRAPGTEGRERQVRCASQRWCLARTSLKSNVLGLMEAGYFSGTMQASDSSRCRLLVDLAETSADEVAEWRRLGWLGEVVLGVDGAGDVWAMEEARGGDEPVAQVGLYRRVASSEDAAGLITVRRRDIDG